MVRPATGPGWGSTSFVPDHRSVADGYRQAQDGTKRPPRPWWRRPVVRHVAMAAIVAVGLYLAVDAVSGAGSELVAATAALEHLNPDWLAVAIGAEAASYIAWGMAERQLLRSGGSRLGLAVTAAQVVAGQALANVLPAGLALSAVASWRWLRRLGVGGELAAWMLAASSSLYVGVLAVLTLLGSVVGSGAAAAVPDLRPVAGAVVALVALVGIGAAVLARRGALPAAAAWLGRHLDPTGGGAGLVAGLQRLTAFRVSRSGWLTVTGLLAAAWLLDCGCLAVSFWTVGGQPPWRGLLLAYGAAQLAATLPITPGGLGVVEGSLTVALVAFGGSTVGSLAAVLLYRLVSFWAILPSGAACYAGLRVAMRRQLAAAGPAPLALAVAPDPAGEVV